MRYYIYRIRANTALLLIRTPPFCHFFGQKRSFLDKNWAKFEYNAKQEPLYFNRTPVFYWRGYRILEFDLHPIYRKCYSYIIVIVILRDEHEIHSLSLLVSTFQSLMRPTFHAHCVVSISDASERTCFLLFDT